MKIGDIVWRSNSGMGRIVDIRSSPAPYLVYFYKENNRLHNGNDRGSDYHYWWSYAEDLKLISSVCTLIERRQHG